MVAVLADSIEGPRSSTETPVKYEDFRALLGIYLRVSLAIMQKETWTHPEYLYFDLNAGCGRNDDGSIGSPLIFRDVADKIGLPFSAWLFEGHGPTAVKLARAIGDDPRFTIVYGDHRTTVADVARSTGHRNAYGLIYADPNNGLLETSAPVVRELLEALPRNYVDVLWYGSGSNVKRVAGAHGHARLIPQIEEIGKACWYLREPRAKHQWTFGFGTNWKGAPKPGLRFGKIGTELGDAYAQQLNETNDERRAKVSPPLPFLLPDLVTPGIGTIPSTSGIPAFGRSVRMRSRELEGGASDADPGQLRFTT